MLVTIEEYAEMHGKTKKAIEYQLRIENLKCVEKFGKRLINSRTKYPKRKSK